MALRKPSDLFSNKSEDNNDPIIESDNSFRDELNRVESLSEQVIQLQQELSQKVVKNDLESLMLSQISSMQENFEYLQNDFKKSNKKDIVEFKEKVSELTEIVGNLVENELPKYKKQVTKNEINIGNKFDELKEVVEENILGIREEIDNKVDDIAEIIDTNLEYFNNQLQETSTHRKIIEDKFKTISSVVNDKIGSIDEEVNIIKDKVSADISSIKADVVISEQHIKNVDKYLQEHHQELVELKEEVFGEIEKLPVGNLQENLERLEKKIDYIKETYSKIEPEVIVKEVIKEGLLNISPNQKTPDPLTPLDRKFVTLDQLQNHYKLFINRIQQQLSTLGGGGETRLRYLDDIVGIATNSISYNGKYLHWNSITNKAEFVNVSSATYATTAGISTYATSSGIATYATTAGISTYATSSGIATYATSSGIATYATSSGIATYATSSGIATYATSSGIATYLADAANIITGVIDRNRINTTSALSVVGDLYVSGNISFGGTTTQLNTEQLQIADSDIILGIGTSFSPTDNTANHGGIAIASTEGTPLVNLNLIPSEILPPTYKKIMWFKGSSIGAGITDAWLFNYGVGIGSTQVPNGVRLAVGGVHITDNTISANSYNGIGSNLTGIVTSIIAGVGITVTSSTGQVTVSSSDPVLQNPTFTYTAGALTSILYSGGATKTFTYTDGVLTQIDLVVGSKTFRKVFNYTGGILTSITETEF